MKIWKFAAVAFAVTMAASGVQAATLSGKGLSVGVRNDNGAINNYSFGEEFFRLGTFVSDYGFQRGNNTSTFGRATATGITKNISIGSVTSTASNVTVTGSYFNFGFTRVYSLAASGPVLEISTTLTNNGSVSDRIRAFESTDPDQGPGYRTVNDVYSIRGARVAQSTNGRSVVMGGPAGGVAGIGGFGLQIRDGGELNGLFRSPNDPNGSRGDVGQATAIQYILAAGQSTSFSTFIAAGNNATAARVAYVKATAPVPLPAGLLLALTGLGSLVGVRGLRRIAGRA